MNQGRKDQPSVDAAGRRLAPLLYLVQLHEMPNIVTGNVITTEVYRPDWGLERDTVQHIMHEQLRAFAISAWHRHNLQTDRIFVTDGSLRLVLYDVRPALPTEGMVTELRLSRMRPTLVTIPPGLWHGLQNMGGDGAGFSNFFTHAYQYGDPDERRLPHDTPDVVYRFPKLP